ncbi:MAG TPA: hypothetical protein VF352_07825 [Anaerolineales bacterium]
MNYTLYARASAIEADSLDITIRFDDGYTVTSLVPTSSGDAMFLQACNEGTEITSP